MQVLKQTINNRNANSLRRAWQLLGVVLSFLPPSPPFRRILQAYLAASMNSKVRGDIQVGCIDSVIAQLFLALVMLLLRRHGRSRSSRRQPASARTASAASLAPACGSTCRTRPNWTHCR